MGKYLITGGCGFIGSHLTEALLLQGHSVKVLDDLSSGKKENIPPHVPLIEASITNRQKLAEALADVDGCFHLAAIPSVEKSAKEWSKTHEVNQTAFIYLIEEIIKLRGKISLIYASSAAVYGNSFHFPLSETEKVMPISPYGVDKLSCEMHANVAEQLYQIPSAGFRFFNVYGPKQDPTSFYSGVITKFINKIIKDEPIEIYGDGNQQRDFVYVKDVVSCLIKFLEKPLKGADVYNICSGDSYSINQLVELLEEILQKKVRKNYLPKRNADAHLSIGDPSKIEKQIGLKPITSLKEGLASLFATSSL